MAQIRATRFAEKPQGVSSVSAYSVRPASQISIFSEQIGNKTLTVRDYVEAGLLTSRSIGYERSKCNIDQVCKMFDGSRVKTTVRTLLQDRCFGTWSRAIFNWILPHPCRSWLRLRSEETSIPFTTRSIFHKWRTSHGVNVYEVFIVMACSMC